MKIAIKPITKTLNTFELSNISVVVNNQFGNSAQITSRIYGDITEVKIIDITPEEYAAWGTDDNYIYDLVLSKLGLERA
jgi:hypothetical protein